MFIPPFGPVSHKALDYPSIDTIQHAITTSSKNTSSLMQRLYGRFIVLWRYRAIKIL